MKRSNKLILICLIFTVVISFAAGIITTVMLDSVKNEEYDTFCRIISAVREKNDDISGQEIIEILNTNETDEESVQLLRSYGITKEDWTVFSNKSKSLQIGVSAGFVCLLSGLFLTMLFLLYNIMMRRKLRGLTKYVSRINEGKYSLFPEQNTEDESSSLQNEIYKTTVVLREQSENAKKSGIMLKDSISDISHQLKTPLTSITLMLDSIADEDMPPELRKKFIRDIRIQTGHISFLIRSLLALSRLDADAIDFHNEKTPVSLLFGSCVNATEIMAELMGVSVKIDDSDDCEILCDRKWTEEALINIVKNCIEHTGEGGTVSLSVSDNKLYTKIVIRDTGCGISKEDIRHIFERFYTSGNSDKESIGIGLALSKAIIERQGGYISVSSEPGVGSEFIIRFFRNKMDNTYGN